MLLLHSRGGLSARDHAYAERLASEGYVVLGPDDLAPVGVTAASIDPATFRVRHYDRVRDDLALALECLQSLPDVGAGRVGIIGFSMGGYFGFVLGSRPEVRAIASYYGAYCGVPVNRCQAKPAFGDLVSALGARVLMFHGTADAEVSVEWAVRTHQLLRAAGKQVEHVEYPGVGHGFDQPSTRFDYDERAANDAMRRTLAFLGDALR